ncbi:glycosyl hydrolase family 28 protein [uncultured Bacteroides sp.]|uniref:glycoside hydrolase family 28 protein n=1 Tax=uncultured Bacteroides sp. TaxID=162156 RepID=UPI00260E7C63|nr:glycosyl hydrolase family 28 protein [uncultured Bacteroides sp.]
MKNNWIYLLAILFCVACTGNKMEKNKICLIPALGDVPLSEQFQVKINGEHAVVEKMGKLDIPIHYTQILHDGKSELQVDIIVNDSIYNYQISPQRKNIEAVVDGNSLSFKVDTASYLLVRINDMEDLYILIDEMKNYAGGEKILNVLDFGVDTTGVIKNTQKIQKAIDEAAQRQATLYFPKGRYYTGELFMRSNMNILLEGGALIMGSIDLEDYEDKALIRLDSVSNFQLLGFGVIDGAGWTGLRKKGAREFHLVYASNCENVLFDGVVLRDPVFWNTRVYRSKGVHFKNLKILNNRPVRNWTNTDGVDFDSSVDCSLVNAVIHAGDDNVVVKGLDSERKFVTEKILFDNVLTISNSAAAKIGTETCVEYFKDIEFRNIDVVRCKRGIVINGFDSARIEKVRFENIYVEGFDYYGNESSRLIDFEITDNSWRECTGDCSIDGVEIVNLNVLTSMDNVESQILGKSDIYGIKNIAIKNSSIKGRPVTSFDDIHLKTNKYVQKVDIIP